MDISPILRAMANDRSRVAVLIFELALTMAIAVNGVALLTRALDNILAETGVDEDGVVVVTSRPFWNGRDDTRRLHDAALRDLEAFRSRADVLAAATISPLPLQGGGSSTHYRPEGGGPETSVLGPLYIASPGVLEVLGVELVAGRSFTMADMPPPRTPDSEAVNQGPVIVTQALADALYPGGDALGKVLHPGDNSERYTIVGIIRYMRTPYGGGPMENRIAIFPRIVASSGRVTMLVRTRAHGQHELTRTAADTLKTIDSDRVVETRTLHDVAMAGMATQRFLAKGLATMLVLLGFVSALAIYGVHSTAVARRRRQIGMRRALGATRARIVEYFLSESFIIATIAMALGVPIAYGLNFALLASQDTDALQAEVVLASIVGFWLVSLVAALGPAYRASRIAPAIASKAR